jgi:hypothetical protein
MAHIFTSKLMKAKFQSGRVDLESKTEEREMEIKEIICCVRVAQFKSSALS